MLVLVLRRRSIVRRRVRPEHVLPPRVRRVVAGGARMHDVDIFDTLCAHRCRLVRADLGHDGVDFRLQTHGGLGGPFGARSRHVRHAVAYRRRRRTRLVDHWAAGRAVRRRRWRLSWWRRGRGREGGRLANEAGVERRQLVVRCAELLRLLMAVLGPLFLKVVHDGCLMLV